MNDRWSSESWVMKNWEKGGNLSNRKYRPGNWLSKRVLIPFGKKHSLPRIYHASTRKSQPKIFAPELGGERHGSRFKWLVSTCIAGTVGLGVIGIVLYASMDMEDGSGVVTSIRRATVAALKPFKPTTIKSERMEISKQKTDRMRLTSKGFSTKHIIHDTVIQQRGGREFITIKPYARIVARLSTIKPRDSKNIPPFDPFKLYANTTPISSKSKRHATLIPQKYDIKVIELVGGILPTEDGQELAIEEVASIVSEVSNLYQDNPYHIRPSLLPETGDQSPLDENKNVGRGGAVEDLTHTIAFRPNTTSIRKNIDIEMLPQYHDVKIITVKSGDSVRSLLRSIGTENWQAKEIITAMKTVYPANNLKKGQKFHFTLLPAASDSGQLEPTHIALYTKDTLEVGIIRNSAGDYIASKNPLDFTVESIKKPLKNSQHASLYTSLYQAALAQNIPADMILKLLRVHAYQVDFKRRVKVGDGFEVFFDLKEDAKDLEENSEPGELLYTSITLAGKMHNFYRFRTSDGTVDFYDETGSSAKKFLMRKPVHGGRYTSGFGLRRHPILRIRRMHNGVDWAAPRGTPVLAAGNGIIEIVGRKGGYGRYIRINHVNGYQTAYGHLYRYAPGVVPGIKVKQGQVIAYVGSSGLSSGAHLHYEVLVNKRHVDPMKIKVPNGRVLSGRLLAEFQKERLRIEQLMHRTPVKTRIAQATN